MLRHAVRLCGEEMQTIVSGKLSARLAQSREDKRLAQRLRYDAFVAARFLEGAQAGGVDCDPYDQKCEHLLIEKDGALLCCCRFAVYTRKSVLQSYSAQFYDLAPFTHYSGRMMEIGRFCLKPGVHNSGVLRFAWAALSQLIDTRDVHLLFGCSSFSGANLSQHAAALTQLIPHIGPAALLPRPQGDTVYFLRDCGQAHEHGAALPSLLRWYLAMGGWVGDHVVADPTLDTWHVFTAAEVAQIPEARRRAWLGGGVLKNHMPLPIVFNE